MKTISVMGILPSIEWRIYILLRELENQFRSIDEPKIYIRKGEILLNGKKSGYPDMASLKRFFTPTG